MFPLRRRMSGKSRLGLPSAFHKALGAMNNSPFLGKLLFYRLGTTDEQLNQSGFSGLDPQFPVWRAEGLLTLSCSTTGGRP